MKPLTFIPAGSIKYNLPGLQGADSDELRGVPSLTWEAKVECDNLQTGRGVRLSEVECSVCLRMEHQGVTKTQEACFIRGCEERMSGSNFLRYMFVLVSLTDSEFEHVFDLVRSEYPPRLTVQVNQEDLEEAEEGPGLTWNIDRLQDLPIVAWSLSFDVQARRPELRKGTGP